MVVINYIKSLFNIKSQLYEDKYKLDHSTIHMDQLKILTKRMDRIDRRRKKHEKFVEDVIESIDPVLLKKDPDGYFIFLTDKQAVKALKKAIENVIGYNKF